MSIDVEGLKARHNLVEVVGHYSQLTKRGAEWVGRCISHSPDNNPSMWVNERKGIVHCFACGFSTDLIGFIQAAEHLEFLPACEFLGATNGHAPAWTPALEATPRTEQPDRITSKPPFGEPAPDMQLRGFGPPSTTWTYRDAGGEILGYVTRYDTSEGKEIRCWTWGQRGEEEPTWGCGHWTKPRPLYHLDQLADRPQAKVLICEGEKAAEAAGALLPPYVAVTWPGGAQAVHRADWSALRGRYCVLWPDADEAGIKAMRELAAVLADPKGLACAVKIIDATGQPDGWDAADAYADAWDGPKTIAWALPRLREYAPPAAGPVPPAAPVVPVAPRVAEPTTAPIQSPPAKPGLRLIASDGNTVAAPEHSTELLPEKLSDDALATYFADQYHDNWRFVPEWSRADKPIWYEWRADCWRQDKLEAVWPLAVEITRKACYWPEAASLTPAAKRAINSAAKAANLLSIAKRDRRIAASNDQWDQDHWLLGVPGGAVDLRTGELQPPRKPDHITRRAAVAPAAGPHPLFDRVLACASGPDPAMQAYLWRWFGYLLTGDTREEAFLFLHGKGGSGKGTLVKTLADILGEYSVTCSTETFTESKQQRHTQELAKLDGPRFAYASETEEGRRWNENLIKLLTGRDKVTAHFMRQNDFEFTPRFKLLIYGNHRPQLKSVGEEMKRRIHLIEYAGNIPEAERDLALKDKLVAEYPAILHSMVQGCLDWQRQGLAKPQAIRDAIDEYLGHEDDIGQWLEDCAVLRQGARIQSSLAHTSYKAWCDQSGAFPYSQKRFTALMEGRDFKIFKSNGLRMIEGFELKASPAPADQRDFHDDPPADWNDR